MNGRPELDRRDKAIAHRPINFLRLARIGGVERRQRSPRGGREAHRQAGLVVIDRLNDVVGQSLKAVDITPWRSPAAEVALQLCNCRGQAVEALGWSQMADQIVV